MAEISRKAFIAGALKTAFLPVLSGKAASPPAKRRPNVLLVIADEWRAQAFGYRGDVNAPTSSLDQFSKSCVDFTNATSPSPVCCPARASLITGQTVFTHRVYLNDVELKPKGVTLGEAFASAGYKTGYIGKWHLYGSPDGHYGRRKAFVPPDHRFGFEYWKAAECDHDYMHSHYYEGNDPTIKYWKGFDSIAQTEDAENFMKTRVHEPDPFFLVLSYGPPHFPYMAPSPYKERWANREIVLRPDVPEAERGDAIKELRGYYAQIDVLNDCFGRLMQTLQDTGAADDTIVVFMSDHGEMGLSHGLKYKNVPWEESGRVPFMVRYPRAVGRTRRAVPDLLSTPDIMPTLLSLANISIPKGVEGYDWSPVMVGKTPKNPPKSIMLSMPVSFGSMREDGISEYRGVRTDRYTRNRFTARGYSMTMLPILTKKTTSSTIRAILQHKRNSRRRCTLGYVSGTTSFSQASIICVVTTCSTTGQLLIPSSGPRVRNRPGRKLLCRTIQIRSLRGLRLVIQRVAKVWAHCECSGCASEPMKADGLTADFADYLDSLGLTGRPAGRRADTGRYDRALLTRLWALLRVHPRRVCFTAAAR